MHSLDVFRCAGDLGKPDVNTTKMHVRGIGKRDVFEVVASGGAGVLRFAMNSEQDKSQVLVRVVVGFVTDIDSERCDDLPTRFCFEMFGGCFVVRICCAQSNVCVGKTQKTMKPFVLLLVINKTQLKPVFV